MGVVKRTAASASQQSIATTSRPSVEIEWGTVADVMSRRCVLAEVWGDSDTGRSTFACSAPGPIAYIHAYEKVDGLLERIKSEGKDVREMRFAGIIRGTTEEMMQLADVEMTKLETAMSDAYNWARTIVLDTHTKAWEICQLARLGSMLRDARSEDDNRKGQIVYGEINSRWKSLFTEFRVRAKTDNRTNLIVIGMSKSEYKKIPGQNASQATGRMISAGQKDMLATCDVRLKTDRSKGGVFSVMVEKPWHLNHMRGMEFDSESGLMNFPSVMGMLTDTDADEWGG